jgi:hypothetical protein
MAEGFGSIERLLAWPAATVMPMRQPRRSRRVDAVALSPILPWKDQEADGVSGIGGRRNAALGSQRRYVAWMHAIDRYFRTFEAAHARGHLPPCRSRAERRPQHLRSRPANLPSRTTKQSERATVADLDALRGDLRAAFSDSAHPRQGVLETMIDGGVTHAADRRPSAYRRFAFESGFMELAGLEPATSCMPCRRSPN